MVQNALRLYLAGSRAVEVEAAVAACHESLGMAGVEAYSRRHGVDAATMSMQVIVQRMVKPELAGVAFSVNPMTGVEEVVIEASAGVADGFGDCGLLLLSVGVAMRASIWASKAASRAFSCCSESLAMLVQLGMVMSCGE